MSDCFKLTLQLLGLGFSLKSEKFKIFKISFTTSNFARRDDLSVFISDNGV